MGKLTKRQLDAFTQRDGEDGYAFVARTIRTLRFRDLPLLLMLRGGDEKQAAAMRLYVDLKMVQWTRALTFGTVILGACTIVAAYIARG
ncbi:MAG: hypothetical protein KatS3mg009_0861 [Acidimicrobiia bacterium]|nr:MAG: hypothetical protein KatS3mg009_0861 [Acidimicrobiia bacterium]